MDPRLGTRARRRRLDRPGHRPARAPRDRAPPGPARGARLEAAPVAPGSRRRRRRRAGSTPRLLVLSGPGRLDGGLPRQAILATELGLALPLLLDVGLHDEGRNRPRL